MSFGSRVPLQELIRLISVGEPDWRLFLDKYTELAATANEMIKFDATEAVSAQPDMSEIDACDLAIKGCGYLPEYVTETFRALPMISCQTASQRCRAAAEKYDGLLKTASQKFQSLAGTSEAA